MNRQEALERAEADSDIAAVVVTGEGWIAVTNEETYDIATTLIERSLHTGRDHSKRTFDEELAKQEEQ